VGSFFKISDEPGVGFFNWDFAADPHWVHRILLDAFYFYVTREPLLGLIDSPMDHISRDSMDKNPPQCVSQIYADDECSDLTN
jgi:hypothetical protein